MSKINIFLLFVLFINPLIACTKDKKAVAKPAAAKTAKKAAGGNAELIAKGKKLFALKTCVACHSTTGIRLVGPPLNGIYGKMEELNNGKKIKVDDAYLRTSLLEPMKHIVKGYPASMVPMPLKEDEVQALIAYIQSLK